VSGPHTTLPALSDPLAGAGRVTIGSLCSGYEGLGIAVQQVLGGRLAWVADPDPGAATVLAHHWPHVPNHGDITATDWDQVEPVDIVLGGYPCQPFSRAGKRKGTADVRHIWPHIADALRVLRPRLAIFENVPGHLSLGFDTVLADLARLGFDADWTCVRASDVGAPHKRDRLFVVAHPADERHERGRRARGRRPGPTDGRLATADTRRPGLEGTGLQDPTTQCGDAPADTAGDGWDERRPEPARQQRGSDAAFGGGSAGQWAQYGPAIDRWARVLGRPAPVPRLPTGKNGGDQLSPLFVEWLMGLDLGHVTDVPGLTRNQQLKLLGNGVVPQQGAHALTQLLDRTEVPAWT
jgi:DNA (cytosine-5)-methyltransferase 1